MKKILILFICFLAINQLEAKVLLPKIYSDHMVLKQNAKVKIWGWTDKNILPVKVWVDWDSTTYSTESKHGYWELEINTPKASRGHQIIVSDPDSKTVIDDVLIGEVWVFSGQSNMEWSGVPGQSLPQTLKEAPQAYNNDLRFFYVEKSMSGTKQDEFKFGKWVVCTPEEMKKFSAIGYFFGKKLNEKLNYPMGLINSNWGGTPAEVWTPKEKLDADPILRKFANQLKEVNWWPISDAALYNAMIHPMVKYKISGVLWYQGEANVETYPGYSKLMETMIGAWREAWGENIPFYYAQIAPWKNYSPGKGALLREQQTKNLSVPNTAMVITHDLVDDITNIHPKLKKEVADRFYSIAIKNVYHQEDGPTEYPIYRSFKVEKNKIRIFFDHAEAGLMVKGDKIENLEIAGEDGKFVAAQGEIDGKTLVIYSDSIKKPVHARFAFNNTDMPNLFSKNGLPVNLFRTDNLTE